MKKKLLKAAAFLTAMILIIGLSIFTNALSGNPISKIIAEKRAEIYLAKNYENTDFTVKEINYSFKDGNYYVTIQSPSSADSYFTLSFDMLGNLKQDNYTVMVLSGSNTARRLEQAYRELTDSIFESPAFPFTGEIMFGDLEFTSRDSEQNKEIPTYGLVEEELELDGLYDIPKLGAKAGHLTVYIEDKDVSIERAAEIMLEIKRLMKKGGAPFYAIDFVLEPLKSERNSAKSEERVESIQFLYADIYKEGMVERVKAANDAATAYYNTADTEKPNTPQQADGACLSLFYASSPQGAGDLHPKGTYPRSCLHSVSLHASHAPLAHSAVKYPWKHCYFPKCPLGTLLAGINFR